MAPCSLAGLPHATVPGAGGGPQPRRWASDSPKSSFCCPQDDNGALYFGESETVGVIIAECPGWSSPRQYDKYPEQTSAPQTLQGQNFYFIRAIAVSTHAIPTIAWLPGMTLRDCLCV